MSVDNPEPNRDLLTELGLVTWRAILLEGLIDSICQFVRPANPRDDRRSIGQKVKDARKVIRGWSESVARDDADNWLVRALSALESRNGLLHATVGRGFEDSHGAVPHAAVLLMQPYLQREPTTLSLGVMPRGATPYSEVSLAQGSLQAVAQQLSDAADGWRGVLLAVDEESKRQIAGDAGDGPI